MSWGGFIPGDFLRDLQDKPKGVSIDPVAAEALRLADEWRKLVERMKALGW